MQNLTCLDLSQFGIVSVSSAFVELLQQCGTGKSCPQAFLSLNYLHRMDVSVKM